MKMRYLSGGVHQNLSVANDQFNDVLERVEAAQQFADLTAQSQNTYVFQLKIIKS